MKLEQIKEGHKEVFDQTVTTLIDDEDTICLLLVGSVVEHSEYKDIDFLLVTRNIPDPNNIVSKLSVQNAFVNLDALKWQSEGDNGIELSIASISTTDFSSKLSGIIQGRSEFLATHTVNWAIGGYFPEAFVGDVQRAVILCDKTGNITEVIDNLRNGYPEEMRLGIIMHTNSEIETKLAVLDEIDIRIRGTVISEIKVSLYRQIFARMREYCPGLRKYDKYISEWNNEGELLSRIINLTDNTSKNEIQEIIDLLNEVN